MINESPLGRKAGRGFVFTNHPKQTAFYMTFLLVNFAVKNATVFFPFLLSRTGLTISVSLLPVSDAVQCNRPCSAVQPSLQCTASVLAVHCIRPCSALYPPHTCNLSRKYLQPSLHVLATAPARTCGKRRPLFRNLFPFPYKLSLPVLWHTAVQAAESCAWVSYVMRTGAREGRCMFIPIWEDPP